MSSPGAWTFQHLYEKIRATPSTRKFAERIPNDNVESGTYKPQPFAEGDSYFEIRLKEMFLQNGREYWREFVPITVCVCDFIYDKERRSLPFIVNNDILKSIEQYVDGQHIEYRNTKMAGPFPYVSGDVAVFVGLFRTKTNDLSVHFCNFIGGLVKTFDVSGLTRYIDLAGPLTSGIEGLLGLKDVEFRLGVREEFSSSDRQDHQFMDGLWAYINVPSDSIDKRKLHVREGKLEIENGGQMSRFRSNDYCLVELVRLEERGDYTTLPFHRQWDKAKQMIWENQVEKAKVSFLALSQELASCADLTRRHRFALMQAYKANFEKELAAYRSWVSPSEAGESYRAGDANAPIDAQSAIQKQTSVLEGRFPEATVSAFYRITALLPQEALPPLKVKEFEYTDSVISAQVNQIEQGTTILECDPDNLAKALAVATFKD